MPSRPTSPRWFGDRKKTTERPYPRLRWWRLLTTSARRIRMKLIRRGVHRSVKDLAKDITNWAENWNSDPKPYVWTKTADDILDTLAAYCQRINDSAQ